MTLSNRNAYTLWGIGALFYLYQFVLRLAPSVMMEDLMRDFSIDATGFAALGSIAMLSYSACQIPLGLFADRYGVRRSILIFLSFCIGGTLIFSLSSTLLGAQVGRFLIGVGSAAAFLCTSKILNHVFPREKCATMLGLTMVVGTIGALNGGLPLCALINRVGWRSALLIMCGIGFILLGVVAWFLKDPSQQKQANALSLSYSLKLVFHKKACWIFATTAIGLYIAICVLGDLWGVAFMMKTHGIERALAVELVSTLYVGLCVGCFVIPWMSDRIKRAKPLVIISILCLLCLLSVLLAPISLPFGLYYPLFSLIGFFSGAEMLCFAGACKAVSSSVAGLITGFINGLVMMGGALAQQSVGVLLDWLWAGERGANGIKIYTISDYRLALSLMIPIIVMALCASLFIKDTHPQQKGT